jgi:hypothetical protein
VLRDNMSRPETCLITILVIADFHTGIELTVTSVVPVL